MYINETAEASLYRHEGDIEQADEVAARLVKSAIFRGGKVQEVHITVRVIGEHNLRPGQEK